MAASSTIQIRLEDLKLIQHAVIRTILCLVLPSWSSLRSVIYVESLGATLRILDRRSSQCLCSSLRKNTGAEKSRCAWEMSCTSTKSAHRSALYGLSASVHQQSERLSMKKIGGADGKTCRVQKDPMHIRIYTCIVLNYQYCQSIQSVERC